jgi:tRNA(adenine34) deaminase
MKPKKWVQDISTDSTSPPEGIFTKDAETIARVMARKDVSPLGIGSAIKMVQYFINRGGKGIAPERREELEKAKKILQERLRKEKKK